MNSENCESYLRIFETIRSGLPKNVGHFHMSVHGSIVMYGWDIYLREGTAQEQKVGVRVHYDMKTLSQMKDPESVAYHIIKTWILDYKRIKLHT